MTITIEIPDELLEFVERQVKDGGFQNISDYIVSLVRREMELLESDVGEQVDEPQRVMKIHGDQ